MFTSQKRHRRLTKHFSYEEMTRTDCSLINSPNDFELQNLLYLCHILESVRYKFNQPIPISSAFRTQPVNHAVGGDPNSYHLDGRACDIDCSSMSSVDIDRLETILWNYHPIELIRNDIKRYIHVAF